METTAIICFLLMVLAPFIIWLLEFIAMNIHLFDRGKDTPLS